MAMFEDFKKHILTVLGVIACVFHVVMIPVLLRLFFAVNDNIKLTLVMFVI